MTVLKILAALGSLMIIYGQGFSQKQVPVQPAAQYDICVYGGTSSGVIAAYTAQKMGKRVILIEPGFHPGGLSTGGLGFTDIGNKFAITGLSRDFYRRVGRHYEKLEQWIFEPHVAEGIFTQYIKEAGVTVLYGFQLTKAEKTDGLIREIHLEKNVDGWRNSGKPADRSPELQEKTIRAKSFIDCSYEGDLMAKAAVSYTVGRESNGVYNETYNGVQVMDKHQFPDGIDPYKIPGDPASGLLWGISPQPLGHPGEGDKKVQAYNFRICLTNDPASRIPIEQPVNYDPEKYALLIRCLENKPGVDLNSFFYLSRLPNHKTDINNNGPFSTDMIGMNYDYPEAGYTERARIIKDHTEYTKGLLYFIGHDERIPVALRKLMLDWGYPKDEYPDNDHWSPQLYIREARRMVGEYVMTQANCQGKEKVEDGIGLAAYTMDSHNCQRVVVNGMVKNEGDVQIGGFPPYPISYRSIIPKAADCKNLFVPVCLSASHIAYGSIRMEPVFMELGQSAAIAAVLAIDQHIPVQQVSPAEIRQILTDNPLADNSTPEILVDNDDTAQIRVQGEWLSEKQDSYGFSRLTDDHSGNQLKSVRFIPNVKKPGKYSLYIFVPKVKNASSSTAVTVLGDRFRKEVMVKTGNIQVEGQTSGEWVAAGSYSLQKGRNNYVEISNKGADGLIIADAILLVPERK